MSDDRLETATRRIMAAATDGHYGTGWDAEDEAHWMRVERIVLDELRAARADLAPSAAEEAPDA